MGTSHRVILDTDIGSDVDDLLALATILGTASIELLGVTTVYADTRLRARLTRRILDIAGSDAPVHAGVAIPLSGREAWWAGHEGVLHDGLENEPVDQRSGVDFLVETVLAHPGEVDVIAIGPLTNIATAIRSDPGFAPSVKALWVMGGQFDPPGVEHNFRSDSTAARIVLDAGIPTTVSGLEITTRTSVDAALIDGLGSSPLAALIAAEVTQWWRHGGTRRSTPHDVVTVLSLCAPDLFAFGPTGRADVSAAPPHEGCSRFRPGEGATRRVIDADIEGFDSALASALRRACSRIGDP